MRVLYLQYTNPGAYPPLVRGAELLSESGAEVLMLGTRVDGLDALSVDQTAGLRVELLEAGAGGWRLKAHYARYVAWVAREGIGWRPDWIYASDVLAAPVALALRAMTGARVVYHEHDAPVSDRDSWVVRRCLAARRHLVQQADLVVAPNAARAARLSRTVAGGRPVLTVWNCPRRSAAVARSAGGGRGDPLRVVFRGSINAERLPATVIQALADVSEPLSLEFAGYETAGSRGYVGHLLSTARSLGVNDRVTFLGAMSPSALAPVCLRSDVGLALMPVASTDENMRHMVGASNKLFEYLGYGVTPLVTDLEDWRTTFVEPGYALACRPDDVASVRRALAWAATPRDELREMADRGLARLQDDWNYETQFEPVLRVMRSGSDAPAAALGARSVRCAS